MTVGSGAAVRGARRLATTVVQCDERGQDGFVEGKTSGEKLFVSAAGPRSVSLHSLPLLRAAKTLVVEGGGKVSRGFV